MSRGPAAALPARAIVFDLDGTLVDSFRAIHASLNHARLALGHAPLDLETVRGLVGWGLERLLAGAFPPGEVEPARDLYRAHHAATCTGLTELLPGVGQTVAELERRGFRLAVATNKPSAFARLVLAAVGLEPRLDLVLGADDVLCPKPHPEMLRVALARLQVGPADALYVGDMRVDGETARAAGVRLVLVATGAEPRQALEASGAERVLDRLGQLLPLVGNRPAPGP
jgi:phosphoglycolate phosphatase